MLRMHHFFKSNPRKFFFLKSQNFLNIQILFYAADYFKSIPTQKITIQIRGGEKQNVEIKHARVYVPAHGRKYNVVALRYEGEKYFRYIITSNLCWRAKDVVQVFTYRWLVEVFFYDWKCYEGWGQAAIQQKNAGALLGVHMSLLVDQCLLSHPEQIRRIQSGLPACTVGSLREKLIVEFHLEQIKCLLLSENPREKWVRPQFDVDMLL